MTPTTRDPTIKKIAQLAGVSRGTVDRVINRRGGVNPETASRIQKIIDEQQYKPNLVAKSLSTKGASGIRSIGVLLGFKGNPFFDDVFAGIAAKEAEIEDFGFRIKTEAIEELDVSLQLEKIDALVEAGVSGLILSPINRPPIVEKLHELQARGIPVICLNIDVKDAPRLCYIGSDYRQCGRVAAGLFGLLANGRPQKLAVITGSFMHLGHDLRVSGFRECAEKDYPNFEIVGAFENNDNDALSYTVTKAVLENHPGLTGLFFGGAGIAGGLSAVDDAGLLGHIPVVCVDLIDAVRNHLKNGNVTATICQEPFKQGFESVRVMFEYLLAGKCPEADIFTETQIMIRHSL